MPIEFHRNGSIFYIPLSGFITCLTDIKLTGVEKPRGFVFDPFGDVMLPITAKIIVQTCTGLVKDAFKSLELISLKIRNDHNLA